MAQESEYREEGEDVNSTSRRSQKLLNETINIEGKRALK
jgi:hypothetical protein